MFAFVTLQIIAVGSSVMMDVSSTRKLAKEQGQGRTNKVLSARLDVSHKVEASVLLGTLGMIVGRMVEARKVG